MIPIVPPTKCPIDITIQILANKWTVSIIRELMMGPKRPSDLERNLSGISAKTLSERLHDLQSWGLVLRQSHPEVPPRVEYSLTPLGRQLEKPLLALKEFGQIWQDAQNAEKYPGDFCDSCPEGRPGNGQSVENCPAAEDLSAKKHAAAQSNPAADLVINGN